MRSLRLALVAVVAALAVFVPLGAASSAATGPDVTLTPSALTFAAQAVGTTAEAQLVTVTNSGDAPLTISTFRINGADAGDFAQGSGCPIGPDTLAPGTSCDIYVSFTPHAPGTKSATLAIGDDAASTPQTVTLEGEGASVPQVALAPAALDFGSVQAGDQSAPQTVTLTNTGSAALSLASIAVAGADADAFSRTATTCDLQAGLAAGDSCTVDVAFAPRSSGTKHAALTFGDDAPGSPQSVALSGTATAAPVPSVGLAPSRVDFGAQILGSSSAAQTVTLTNTGGATLTLGSIALAGDTDFHESNDCPGTLPAGAACTIQLVFAPTAEGTRTDSLTITDDAADSPQSLALSGTGAPAGTYLVDDFESGSLAQWNALSADGSTIQLDSSTANSGAASVRFTNSGDQQSSRLYADLAGGGHAQSYTRFCFRIAPGLQQGIEIANGRAITTEYPLGIRRWEVVYNPVTEGLEAYFFNEQLQRLDLYAANGRVLTGQWYCAEIYLDESADGYAQLWLDGIPVGSVSGDLSTPDPYDRMYLWNQPTAGTVWFDDVKVADSPIGPTGAGVANLPGPTATLDTSSLPFYAQTVQTASAAKTVSLTNTGGTPLTLNGIGIQGTGDFAETNDCPSSLAAGASCTISVTFTPVATGSRSATLTFDDNAPGSPQGVALSGIGVAQGTYLSDDFESGSLGQWSLLSSADSTIATDTTVVNSGTGAVRLTNNSNDQSSRLMADLADGGHAQSYTRFCFEIAPGATGGIEIANGRAINDEYPLGIRRFVIDYNAAAKGIEAYFFNEQLQRLDMYAATGRVVTGRWYCAELYLDESLAGHAKLWLDGTLVGSVDGDLSTPSPYSRFYLWNQATAGTVWFDDVVVSSAPIGPTGAGAADLPGPQAALAPSTIDFGSQTTGTTSAPQTVTITNSGESAMTIYGISLDGPNAGDFAQTNTCPQTLGAGASCTASVTFAPGATGSRTATLTVGDDASGSPHSVALGGTGTAPDAAVATLSPGSLSFGSVLAGSSSTAQQVSLTNAGTLTMTISAIALTGANAADFDRSTTCGATLAVGASCTIDVTFTPGGVGSRTASLVVSSDAVGGSASVALAGDGALPAGTYLTDGFESGLGAWHTIGDGTETTQTATVHSGGAAAALTNAADGGYAGIYEDFGAQAQTTTRFCFALTGTTAPFALAQGRDANGLPLWEIDYDPGLHGLDVYVWNGARARSDLYTPLNAVALDHWYCLALVVDEASAGHAELQLDGRTVASVDGDLGVGDAYSRLFLWNNGAAGTAYLDDVSVKAS